jgi:hypothetical protein
MSVDSSGKGSGRKPPPKEHRFVKGKSGNPRGRPRGSVDLNRIAEKVARRRIPILINGRQGKATVIEALLRQLMRLAAGGNVTAARLATKLHARVTPDKRGGYLVVPERLTMEEWCEKYSPKTPLDSEEQ